MSICPVDSAGYCARHRRTHKGAVLELALRADPEAERYRDLWDQQVARTYRPSPPPQRERLPRIREYLATENVRCVHRGPDQRTPDGRAITRDCGLG